MFKFNCGRPASLVEVAVRRIMRQWNHHQDWPKTGFQSLLSNGHFDWTPVTVQKLHDRGHNGMMHKCNLNTSRPTTKPGLIPLEWVAFELNALSLSKTIVTLPLNLKKICRAPLFDFSKMESWFMETYPQKYRYLNTFSAYFFRSLLQVVNKRTEALVSSF